VVAVVVVLAVAVAVGLVLLVVGVVTVPMGIMRPVHRRHHHRRLSVVWEGLKYFI
jgi:hypothetical protein